MTIRTTVIDDEGDEHVLPTKWEICSDCRGEGKSSAHLGAFTAEDMHEQGPEFMEEYMNGMYDKQCDTCHGTGKVKVVDEDQLPEGLLKLYLDALVDDAYMDAMSRAEREMGA